MSERRSLKRKAAADDEQSTPSSKRQKNAPAQSVEEVREKALRLVESMKNAKDKNGRSITDLFLSLPSAKELPDYYHVIKLPIAIDTIEDKIHDHEYTTLTQVESDFRRMVANAKQYNDDGSEVFQDAERVRKLLYNWMKVHNPAYKDPEYVAFPTPIPEDGQSASKSASTDEPKEEKRTKRPTITLSKGRRASEAKPTQATPAPAPAPSKAYKDIGTDDFAGKTFSQVQEQILEEFIQYREDELLPYSPFVHLPPRALTDYYQLIKRPVCLKSVQKKSRGQHGREAPTGVTDFKTWDAFGEEVSLIWLNAKSYNEDGSEMFQLAEDFEAHFKGRLAHVRTLVDEPQAPRIKLNTKPPKTILHLGTKHNHTSTATPTATPYNDASQRQKQAAHPTTQATPTPQPSRSSESAAPADAVSKPPEVKTEQATASPASEVAPPESAAIEIKPSPTNPMLPPARMSSHSPHPAAQSPAPPAIPQITTPILPPTLATWSDTFARSRAVSEALLPNIHLSSHPQLNVSKPYSLDISASTDYTQQSITIMLPSSLYYLQASPTVSQQLSSGRQYKLFVTVNATRVSPSMRPMLNGDATNGLERKQVYDVSLSAGVNRIEVEIVAVTGRGGTLEVEKTTIFANLLRR